jgi:O-antigen/teichoic acid export membrane protein
VAEASQERTAVPAAGEAPPRLARAARTDRQLLARSSITLFSRGFSKLAQVFFLVIAARLLSVDEFATYSYLIVLATGFTLLSDTGVPLVAGRDASAGRWALGDLFWSALPIVLVSAVAAAAVLVAFGAVDSGPGTSTVPVLIMALFIVFNRFFDLISQLLRGVGRFELEAALQLANAIGFIGGSVAVIAAGYGVTAVLAVFCLKELACCIAGWVAIRRDVRRAAGAGARAGGWRRLVGIGVRLSLAGMALALAMRVPLAVLGNIGTSEELALFSAAQRFADASYVLAITGGWALVPGLT